VISVESELTAHGLRPRKKLGQHFLIDRDVMEKLVEVADLGPSDTVLEIGAGTGSLTSMIEKQAGTVVAVEKDPALTNLLSRKFAKSKNVKIVEGDILKIQLPKFDKVVSSPPYNISSKLVLLLLKKNFERLVLVLQKEFAERLVAQSGSRNYGRLTVMVGHKAHARLIDIVPRHAFYPTPKVDSAIVKLRPKESPIRVFDEQLFCDLVRELFTQRRRRLQKAILHLLRRYGDKSSMLLPRLSIPEKRVYQTNVEEFESLANELYDALR
jgi:16S rRNA (adenine1518-N6/adenine1519-N6)-dimethyltransferase